MQTRGLHLLLEFSGCSAEPLSDHAVVRAAMLEAAAAARATVIKESLHGFSPYGVTGLVLLAESHISIHTWPEAGYAAVDVFTCGTCRPELSIEVFARHFQAAHVEVMRIERGLEHRARTMAMTTHRALSVEDVHLMEEHALSVEGVHPVADPGGLAARATGASMRAGGGEG